MYFDGPSFNKDTDQNKQNYQYYYKKKDIHKIPPLTYDFEKACSEIDNILQNRQYILFV